MRIQLVPALVLLATALHAADAAAALDQAIADLPTHRDDSHAGHDHGKATPDLRLIAISLAVVGAVGASTATDAELESLNAGGHDPHGNGFTLQTAELSISGAVDPYFTAEAHIAASPEHGVELEEAYITTSSLPYALEVKAGYQLIEFGRINASHTHAWSWIDQPVIASRLLGGDGSRTPGARVSWLAPVSWYSQVVVGAYNSDDASMASFQGGEEEEGAVGPQRTIAGRLRSDELTTGSMADLTYLLRWENAADIGGAEAKLGLSWMGGPNASGVGERSNLYGADLVVGMKPAHGPFSSIKVTAEAIYRSANVPESLDPGTDGAIGGGDDFTAPAATLSDWGLYAQAELGFGEHWSCGIRGEYATATGDSVVDGVLVDHDTDGLRDTRVRVSPMVTYRPSEFSRLRLQYDYDHAEHLEDAVAHSVWLGLDVLIGAHPAHGF